MKNFYDNFDENYFDETRMRVFTPELSKIWEPMSADKRKDFVKSPEFRAFFVNEPRCTACQGQCCVDSGCMYTANDFEDFSIDAIKKVVDKKHALIAIAPNFLYLRAPGKNDLGRTTTGDGARSTCVHMGPTGCKFDFDHRPTMGTLLVPAKRNCITICNGDYVFDQWRDPEKQKVLNEIIVSSNG